MLIRVLGVLVLALTISLTVGCEGESLPAVELKEQEEQSNIDDYLESPSANVDSMIAAPEPDQYDNPYYNPDSLYFFEYYVFELFRGAQQIEFAETLEYNAIVPSSGGGNVRFEVLFPQIGDTSQFAESFNDYYHDRLEEVKTMDALPDGYVMFFPCGYEQKVRYAYTWGNIYTVMINEAIWTSRAFVNPLFDNFDSRTGSRLTLDNVFTVDYDNYCERISNSLSKLDIDNPPLLDSWYENSTQRIPLPESGNFLLTPHGLALVYRQGEVASMAEGPVILFVDYESVLDILNTELVYCINDKMES